MQKPSEHRLDVGTCRLRVLSAGQGANPIVVLASPVVHAGAYRTLIRALASVARVCVVDLPGSGRSSRVKQPLTAAEHAELVPQVFNALGLSKAILIGRSNSGPIDLQAASRYPDRIEHLVLVDTVGAHPAGHSGRLCSAGRLMPCSSPGSASPDGIHSCIICSFLPRACSTRCAARLATAC